MHGAICIFWASLTPVSLKYATFEALAREVPRLCADIAPVEIMPAAGDVFFYDIMLAHAGSNNLARAPRLAINHKVRNTPCRPRRWANFRPLWLYSHRNAWANLRFFLHQSNTFLA